MIADVAFAPYRTLPGGTSLTGSPSALMEWLNFLTHQTRRIVSLWKKEQGRERVGDTYVYVNTLIAEADTERRFPFTPNVFESLERAAFCQKDERVFHVTQAPSTTVRTDAGDVKRLVHTL